MKRTTQGRVGQEAGATAVPLDVADAEAKVKLRRDRLDRHRILLAAVEFIDEEGLRALTMRRLGARLGVEAMSLYRYVPGKDSLLDGIVETVIDGLYGDPQVYVSAEQGWQEYLQRLAHGVRGALSPVEEQELYRHYGLSEGAGGADSGTQTQQGQSGQGERSGQEQSETAGGEHAKGRDTSGRNTDAAMTRSEEQLRVGTQSAETGRARLRKYVVTEQQTQTVPVSHEEVRIEREPISEDNRGSAADGPGIGEDEHEVVLHAEKPVVEKETVPVERVTLGTETVRAEETVTEEVRKEQIETDGDVDHDSGR